jgi:hypothetical protein
LIIRNTYLKIGFIDFQFTKCSDNRGEN